MSYRLCRHIKANGLQCQSPAMRLQRFCYYHIAYRRRSETIPCSPDPLAPALETGDCKDPAAPQTEPLPIEILDLGALEDATSIQVAISAVVSAAASQRIDAQQAVVLFAGLRLAALNYRNLRTELTPTPRKMLRIAQMDDDGNLIAHAGLHEAGEWRYPDEDTDPDALPGPTRDDATPAR